MKKMIFVLGVVITALLVAPYFVGSVVRTNFNEVVEKTAGNPTFNITLKDYQQGWFSSMVTMNVDLVVPGKEADDFNFDIRQTIKHGPVLTGEQGLGIGLLDNQMALNVGAVLRKEMDFPARFILKMDGRVGFSGGTNGTVSTDGLEITKDGMTTVVEPGDLQVSFDGEKRFVVNGTLAGMKVSGASKPEMVVGPLRINMVHELVAGEMFSTNALYDGEAIITIANMMVNVEELGLPLTLESITLSTATDVIGELMNISLKSNAKELKFNGESFKNINYDISLNNLSVKSIQEMSVISQEMQLALADPTVDSSVYVAKMEALLPALLAKKPTLAIKDLGVVTEQGPISINGNLAVDESLFSANNPMSILAALNANANGEGPDEFFTGKGLGAMVEQFVQQKMILRKSGKLVFDFTMTQGKAILNGNQIPLGAL